ncbi:M1 family aminopeptidase [Flavobacterium humi]|uniref:Aminopeptidase N n=1 Tax=Flavobacterium humi TaxID=2562683 RepID=A0A4Z0L6A7_9FLAO|nr:M1 family aminopeptidase [Flavobacterium humi]TGD57527.1 T9SS type A sorting domain-containing protein [Flavobacterium humi]
MKKITYLLVFLSAQISFCQTDTEHDKMVEAEMKSASEMMAVAVNPNTQNYDVTYSKLEFTVNPSVLNVSGKVTTTFKALSNMNTVVFDFYKKASGAFTISSVKKDGASLAFSHNSTHELVITLPATLTAGNSATIEIIYSGVPSTLEGAFTIGSHNGNPVLWTLSEPFGARDWWPCKQDLNDKIDNGIDVYITAPSQYVSVANGIEPEAPIIVGANKTTHFRHGYPIAAYLVAIAVTNYQIFNQQGGLGTAQSPFFPIVNYIYPEESATTQASLAVTPDIINFYETKFGPYPYRNEKYGHARANLSGGMEHTTVSFMQSWSRGLIAHEMGHQWFGDKVTCGSWKDIWLNEGITEYLSGLVVEQFDGPSGFVSWKDGKSLNVTSVANGAVYLTDVEATNVGRIFSNRLTYNKGAMVTHMLRFKLGDTNFFQGLRDYLNDPTLSYAYAVTPQFQAHLETVFGSSLQEFFNDWVYGQGYPTYTINAHNSAPGQATIQISQTQSDPSVSFFEMPVPVRLTGGAGQQLDVILNNTADAQSFVVNVPFVVTGVEFDPNKDIISRNNTATLGMENFNPEGAIQLYPNPVADVLTISIPESFTLEKVVLFNALGQKSLETNQLEIPVSQLAPGIYVAAFETSNGTFHKKIIKK